MRRAEEAREEGRAPPGGGHTLYVKDEKTTTNGSKPAPRTASSFSSRQQAGQGGQDRTARRSQRRKREGRIQGWPSSGPTAGIALRKTPPLLPRQRTSVRRLCVEPTVRSFLLRCFVLSCGGATPVVVGWSHVKIYLRTWIPVVSKTVRSYRSRSGADKSIVQSTIVERLFLSVLPSRCPYFREGPLEK